jgi:hypothetical protein
VAEVVNGRTSRREGERLERFLEHLVEVFPRGEAGGDVRMIILAGMLFLPPKAVCPQNTAGRQPRFRSNPLP